MADVQAPAAPQAQAVQPGAVPAPAAEQPTVANPSDKPDLFDKALDSAERAVGKSTGHNVDPAKYRAQNEKFTDKLRAWIQKVTGKKVPEKISN